MTAPKALDRKQMISIAMWAIACTAAGPLIVQQGSIPATYGFTGVLAVPLVIVITGAVLGLLSVGYTAMSRLTPHPAVYYAVIGRGLGRPMGVAAGVVALLGYNTIQTSLYGFLGWQMSDVFGGPWWAYALVAVPVVLGFGVVGVTRLTVALVVVLVLSVFMVVLFILGAVADPAEGLNTTGFELSGLTGGVGGAFAYALASAMGFEAAATFSEESRTSRGPGRAAGAALAFLIALYALTAWATGITAGASQVTTVPVDPMAVFDDQYGPLMPPFVRFSLILAILASMIALHSFAARYAFAMAREGVLPRWVQSTGHRSRANAPVGGSLLQSGIAVLVIVAFAIAGTDPLASLFAYFSTLGALSLLFLLVLTSVAALAYLPGRGPDAVNLWTRRIAPGLGVLSGAVVAVLMVVNVDKLLGTAPGSPVPALLIGAVVVVFVAGLAWAAHLRVNDTDSYQLIGQGQPDKYAGADERLSKYNL